MQINQKRIKLKTKKHNNNLSTFIIFMKARNWTEIIYGIELLNAF